MACSPTLTRTACSAPSLEAHALLGLAARRLRIGDRVYMRHAKAGELCERFGSLYLVEGDRIVDQVPTYRGDGKAFL